MILDGEKRTFRYFLGFGPGTNGCSRNTAWAFRVASYAVLTGLTHYGATLTAEISLLEKYLETIVYSMGGIYLD